MDSCVSAKLIALTQPVEGFPAKGPEGLIAHCARVSSPREYDTRGEDYEKLFDYCVKNKHWSVFEMANAVVEVKAPRDISRQLLRHRSFHFQEFSQRYSDDIEFCDRELRLQDKSNRQNSIQVDSTESEGFEDAEMNMSQVLGQVNYTYDQMRQYNVAKECARVILPEGLTMSTLYVNGTLRDWFHYLEVREGNGTQLEHVWLANVVRRVLAPEIPILFAKG